MTVIVIDIAPAAYGKRAQCRDAYDQHKHLPHVEFRKLHVEFGLDA